MNGKHILLSLHVPEEQMRAGLQQMRAAQAAQTAAVARPARRDVFGGDGSDSGGERVIGAFTSTQNAEWR